MMVLRINLKLQGDRSPAVLADLHRQNDSAYPLDLP